MVLSLRVTTTIVFFCFVLFFQTTFAQLSFGGRVIAPTGGCAIPPGFVYAVFDFAQKRPLFLFFPATAAIPFFSLKAAFIYPPYPGIQVLGKYVPFPGSCLGAGFPIPTVLYEGIVTLYGSSPF